MTTIRCVLAIALFASTSTAAADAVLDEPIHPPSASPPRAHRVIGKPDPLATTERWGGGLRLTGMSGIGALPGVNFGGEVAVHVRRDELFGELALGRWKPEHTQHVLDASGTGTHELGIDMWTLRAGWASMRMPLRMWGLVEVGEIAGAGPTGMHGVVPRMVMGDTPSNRQWRALGAGLGVAWPLSQQARLVGNMELAVPIQRERLMVAYGEAYEPDPMAARYSVGLEVGWR